MYKKILLPVSNPANSEYTLKAAIRLLDPAGTIIILSILEAGERYPDRSKSYGKKTNLVLNLLKIARYYSVDAIPEIESVTSISEAILDYMVKYDVDLTILGYSRQSTFYKLRHGDIIYPVLQNASSEILLSNFSHESTFKNILIPSAGYAHSIKAFEIAKFLTANVDGQITLLHITEEGESHTENYLKKLAASYENTTVEIRSGDIADQIIATAKGYDLLMMGASERPRGLSILFGTTVDKVMDEATTNIFVVKV